MSGCPTSSAIDRWLAGELNDAEETRIDVHLRDCSVCLEILNEKTAVPEALRDALASSHERRESGSDPVLDGLLETSHSAVGDGGRNVDSKEEASPEQPASARPCHASDIPGYELLEEIGRGGLGIVFKARQVSLDRIVAVKMLRSRTFAGSSELARFHLEAEAVAGLQHANIVQVYDIIEHDGSPCLFMEYVPGEDLSSRLGGTPQPPESAARLVEILARAMHSVHEAGFLHRDLKPANILLAGTDDADSGVWLMADDGVSATLLPKITDFGLAKQRGADRGLTETHSVLGTPSYMSPEQARAAKEVTPAADVYSLGAILYEALVGRPPFRSPSVLETMAQVIHEDPVPPRRLVGNIPVDLEAVCLKCLEKEPARRYASAEALAEDLHRIQEGRQTIARPMTAVERIWRWCRRNRAMASLLAVLVLTLVTATTVTSVGLVRARRAEEARSIEAKQARQARDVSTEISHFLREDILAAVAPDRQGRDVRMSDVLDSAAMRIDKAAAPGGRFADKPDVHASIRHTIGQTYFALGRFADALPHLERALLVRRQTLGDEHVETLDTAVLTALLYDSLGRPDDALTLTMSTLDAQTRVLGVEDVRTMRTMIQLATMHKNGGRLDEAAALYVRTIEIQERVLDEEHELCLSAKLNLANVYYHRGQKAEYESLSRQVLAIVTRKLGPEHPKTLTTQSAVAAAVLSQDRNEEAVSLLVPLLEKQKRVLGAEHEDTLMTCMKLGAAYVVMKRYDEAAPLLERVVEITERQQGPHHRNTLIAVFNLGNLYSSQRRFEVAISQYERASAMAVRLWPDRHWITSACLGGRGDALVAVGRFEEAEASLTEAHKNALAVRGPDDGLTVQTIQSLVKLYEAWSKPDEAATWRAKLGD